jgi:hypothetical protein
MAKNNDNFNVPQQKLSEHEASHRELEIKIKDLEKLKGNLKVIGGVLLALGVSGSVALGAVYKMMREAQDLRDKAFVAAIQADSTAKIASKIANELKKELEGMDVKEVGKELEQARENYTKMVGELNTVKMQHDNRSQELANASKDYKAMIKQLNEGIYLYTAPPVPGDKNTAKYLMGEIYLGVGDQAKLDGKDVIRQRFWLAFDPSTSFRVQFPTRK